MTHEQKSTITVKIDKVDIANIVFEYLKKNGLLIRGGYNWTEDSVQFQDGYYPPYEVTVHQ